jgi:hypothetical protein
MAADPDGRSPKAVAFRAKSNAAGPLNARGTPSAPDAKTLREQTKKVDFSSTSTFKSYTLWKSAETLIKSPFTAEKTVVL